MTINRREFLLSSASLAVMASRLNAMAREQAQTESSGGEWPGSGKPSPFLNYNSATLIGLGDEPPTFLDQFGQPGGRRTQVLLDVDYPVKPFQNDAITPNGDWAQWLESGYLPIVRTRTNAKGVSIDWTAFTSEYAGVKADYVVLNTAAAPLRLRLAFPCADSVRVEGNKIVSDDKIWAIIPAAKVLKVTTSRYNMLSPESWCNDVPRWDPRVPAKQYVGLANAFNSSRGIYLNRSVNYRIPATETQTHHVYLGLITSEKFALGESILRLTVNGQTQLLDLGIQGAGNPAILEFAVAPQQGSIYISSECDPSSMSVSRHCFLNGVWVFERAVNRDDLKIGKLDDSASVHIHCGHESLSDVAATVELEFDADQIANSHLLLPYDLPKTEESRAAGISASTAKAAVIDHWNSFLARGAQFRTGVPHLDNLYRTCVVNIFLMRTRHPGAAADGGDLYVVKPGAGIYDNFWTRDGSYIATSLGLAGYPSENEQSLRLFWQHGLKGIFASWGQQPAGFWQSPINQWDSNGQALWALVQHFVLTRDREWLKNVYPSIRRGALWIGYACEQMKYANENGERPIYYGLLPAGEGESIASGINYYHDFWAVLGLRQAAFAAEALGETADAKAFSDSHDDLRSNLVRSVSWAFQRAGEGKYIPATPFQPGGSIWGSANALYPCGFLDPQDPMMSATLATLDSQMEEDVYIYSRRRLWTYITADIAMCHLLRNELDQFYRFYNGFVAHASPTNAWVEGIVCDDQRRGTGDMPHGWAAAEYIFLHRNSLVYENGNTLELCWGVQPEWLSDGSAISAKNAPTRFGKVNLEVRRGGDKLAATFSVDGSNFPSPRKTALHVPRLDGVNEITINLKRFPLKPGPNVLTID